MVKFGNTEKQIAKQQREDAFIRSRSEEWFAGYNDQTWIPTRSQIDTKNNEYDHFYNPHPAMSQEWSDYRDGVKYAYEEAHEDDN